jgi:hypothetical protein
LSADDPNRRLAGRVILCAMISLFVGLAFGFVSLVLGSLSQLEVARVTEILAKVFLIAFLPLLLLGILMRVAANAERKP